LKPKISEVLIIKENPMGPQGFEGTEGAETLNRDRQRAIVGLRIPLS